MKASIVRTGGFAGIQMTTTVDTDTLEPEDVRQLQQLVKSSEFFSLPATIVVSKSQPDRFQYKVTIEDGSKTHTVTVGETSLPSTIKPLLDFLNQNAKRAS
jgi:hypothetical protein